MTDEQLLEAEDMWDRYLKVVLQIFERLEAEGRLDEIPPAEWIPDPVFCEKCGNTHPPSLDQSESPIG